VNGQPPSLPPQPPSDGDEVEMLDGARFRYCGSVDLFLEVRNATAASDTDDDDDEMMNEEVERAIDTYVWAKDDPTVEHIEEFVYMEPDLAVQVLYKLISGARKFTLLDDEDDEIGGKVHYNVSEEECAHNVKIKDKCTQCENDTIDGVVIDPIFDYSMGCG
jgi:hypothetical protein